MFDLLIHAVEFVVAGGSTIVAALPQVRDRLVAKLPRPLRRLVENNKDKVAPGAAIAAAACAGAVGGIPFALAAGAFGFMAYQNRDNLEPAVDLVLPPAPDQRALPPPANFRALPPGRSSQYVPPAQQYAQQQGGRQVDMSWSDGNPPQDQMGMSMGFESPEQQRRRKENQGRYD